MGAAEVACPAGTAFQHDLADTGGEELFYRCVLIIQTGGCLKFFAGRQQKVGDTKEIIDQLATLIALHQLLADVRIERHRAAARLGAFDRL